jgi:hypothetical protein
MSFAFTADPFILSNFDFTASAAVPIFSDATFPEIDACFTRSTNPHHVNAGAFVGNATAFM